MNDKDPDFSVGFLLVFLVMGVITFTNFHANSTILEAGHAEYSRTTGEFQLLPACNEETK